MDIQFIKDLALIVAVTVNTAVGIFDRKNVIKAKDAQIDLLKARIDDLVAYETPEAVYKSFSAKILRTEEAMKYAQEEVEKLIEDKKMLESKVSQAEGKNSDLNDQLEKLQYMIDAKSKDLINVNENVKTLEGSITAGTAASTIISSSAIYQNYVLHAEPGSFSIKFPEVKPILNDQGKSISKKEKS
ncbi:MAG: hypothetical protein MUO42_10390 [Anaerolineaceae bacterium]|nr:hypothetical protein [Anaerolineaceae bacterium]